MLVRTIRPASSGSSGARSWSPRTPKASIAMSTSPSASGSQGGPSAQVRAQDATGVEPLPQRPPVIEPRVHDGQELGPEPGVLGEVDPPAGGGDGLVDAVEQRSQPGDADGDVECQGP